MIIELFLILYGIVTIGLIIGASNQSRLKTIDQFVPLSILVPAKDESQNIFECIEALVQQNYPKDMMDIIIIDDESTDSTVEIVNELSQKFQHLRLIKSAQIDVSKKIIGKARAITAGVEEAKHDIIVMTDADCRPNPNWLATIASHFLADVGVVSGLTVLQSDGKNRLFAILQSIDWVFLLGAGSAAVGLKHPISCIGSNLAFRKEIFLQVGGYEKLEFSITEDLKLYKTFAKKTDTIFRFPMSENMLNWSKPMTKFSDYYRQRKRWALGSFDINFFGGILLAIAIGAHVFAVLPLFSIFTDHVTYLPLLSIFLADSFMIAYFLIKIKQQHLILFIPFYFLFYLINVCLLSFVLIFDRKVSWKGRRYSKDGFL